MKESLRALSLQHGAMIAVSLLLVHYPTVAEIATTPISMDMKKDDSIVKIFARSVLSGDVMNNDGVTRTRQVENKEKMLTSPFFQAVKNYSTSGNENRNQNLLQRRHLEEDPRCDAAFYSCMPNEGCGQCFSAMAEIEMDWAGVSSETSCEYVLDLLDSASLCTQLQRDNEAKDLFCSTFNACVVWGETSMSNEDALVLDDYFYDYEEEAEDFFYEDDSLSPVDCHSLDECYWDGIHMGFIGDGMCNFEGCYNSKVCGYDGGDCCEDTCTSSGDRVECGVDGYFCKDPESRNCQHYLNPECAHSKEKGDEGEDINNDGDEREKIPQCDKQGENLYKIVKYDSWGDGWDDQYLQIAEVRESGSKYKKDSQAYRTTLTSGKEGESYLCLHEGCYEASIDGGMWGNEISWEIHTGSGGPTLARGGAPMDCTFPVGVNACENTCTEIPQHEDNSAYEEVVDCLNSKCLVQFKSCTSNGDCAECLSKPNTPAYCFTNVYYDALVTCSICQCSDKGNRPEYCLERGSTTPGKNGQIPSGNAGMCNAQQVLGCSAAVVEFSSCSQLNAIDSVINEWDNDNFGNLDTFEACAHSYAKDHSHGANTAMDCMNKLVRILDDKEENPFVVDLATKLYTEPEYICDCTTIANNDCPFCTSFSYFKILLREVVDACTALDEIDCPAWLEFSKECKLNMMDRFNRADFKSNDQCDYIRNGCGGVGPFPAFRRLDCDDEIPKNSWDFYQMYVNGCGEGSNSLPSKTEPAPVPVPVRPAPAPSSSSNHNSNVQPTKPYQPYQPEGKPYHVPYKSPDSEDTDNASDFEEEKKEYKSEESNQGSSHTAGKFLLWTFVISGICAVGFFTYKKRRDQQLDYVRYHRYRNANSGDDELDSSNSMFNSMNSGNFQPVSLPPVANPSIQMM